MHTKKFTYGPFFHRQSSPPAVALVVAVERSTAVCHFVASSCFPNLLLIVNSKTIK